MGSFFVVERPADKFIFVLSKKEKQMAKDTTRKGPSSKKENFLESAAQAIGSTLGDLAVKTGIAKPEKVKKSPVRSSAGHAAPRKATRKPAKAVAVKRAGKGAARRAR
jgi:hypothetical protein